MGALPPLSRDGSSHMGAVPVVICGVSGAGDGVDPMNIVDVSVLVVVEAIVWDFFGVFPKTMFEVFVCCEDPRVDNPDGHIGPESFTPSFFWVCADVWVFGVSEGPRLILEVGFVWGFIF